MIRYFKINDPYRLLVLLLLLVVGRLPWFLGPGNPTLPELDWMVAGERISGGALLYVDLWDELAPLSALVYAGIDALFGRAHWAYLALGLALYFVQAAYFNAIMLRRKVFNEYTYVPALIYGLLGLLFFDLMLLSPQLMALTALLVVLDNTFGIIASRQQPEAQVLNTGLFLAIAGLFYLPMALFAIPLLLGLLLYSNLKGRGFLLLLYGLFAPFLLIWLYYYWRGEGTALQIGYFHGLFRLAERHLMPFLTASLILAFPAALFGFSLLRVLRHPGFINYQVCLHWIFILTGITALAIWLLWADRSGSSALVFLPALAFFIAQYFQLARKAWIRESLFLLLLAQIAVFTYGPRTGFTPFAPQTERLLTARLPAGPRPPEGLRILVTGTDRSYYLQCKQATPYFKWRLARQHLNRLDYYDNLAAIYRNFSADMPQAIVDPEGVMPEIFRRIPGLKEAYRQEGGAMYYLR